jgi:DNA-binding NarL/FixJ family response regulator
MKPISIIIVEDQQEHQNYLTTIVNSEPDMRCLATLRYGMDAIQKIAAREPDIALIDIGLPDISGIEVIHRLVEKEVATKFMICTVNEQDEMIFDALKAGAHGYILKKSKPYQIIDALREMNDGGTPVSSIIASKILESLPLRRAKEDVAQIKTYGITPTERNILNHLAKGYSYQECADALCISEKTVKWHVHKIYGKLHAKNRVEALNRFFNGGQ